MTIEEKIEAALFRHVVGLDFDTSVPVAWPNTVFPAEGEPKPTTYIEVVHFRNDNQRLFLKGTAPHQRQGILQLTAVTPLNGGPGPATALAGEIAEQFPADLRLYEDGIMVRIEAAPDVMSPDRTDVSWDVPVSIRYEALI